MVKSELNWSIAAFCLKISNQNEIPAKHDAWKDGHVGKSALRALITVLFDLLLILLFHLLFIFLKFSMIQSFDFTPTAPATTSSVAPIPTVIPGSEVYQELHDVGKRTLWYVNI